MSTMNTKWIHLTAKGSGNVLNVAIGIDFNRLSDHPCLSIDMDDLEVKLDDNIIISAKEPEKGTPYETLYDVKRKWKTNGKKGGKKNGND